MRILDQDLRKSMTLSTFHDDDPINRELSNAARCVARAISATTEQGDIGIPDSPSRNIAQPSSPGMALKPLSKSPYCLLSPLGFATEDGFTDDPSEAIQIQELDVAIARAASHGTGLVPIQVTFEKHGDFWHPITA